MAKLSKHLPAAEPVDRFGNIIGPPVALPAGTEFSITVPKLLRPGDSFDACWCEIDIGGKLYRLPRRVLDTAA